MQSMDASSATSFLQALSWANPQAGQGSTWCQACADQQSAPLKSMPRLDPGDRAKSNNMASILLQDQSASLKTQEGPTGCMQLELAPT